jgi:hypothetical protein
MSAKLGGTGRGEKTPPARPVATRDQPGARRRLVLSEYLDPRHPASRSTADRVPREDARGACPDLRWVHADPRRGRFPSRSVALQGMPRRLHAKAGRSSPAAKPHRPRQAARGREGVHHSHPAERLMCGLWPRRSSRRGCELRARLRELPPAPHGRTVPLVEGRRKLAGIDLHTAPATPQCALSARLPKGSPMRRLRTARSRRPGFPSRRREDGRRRATGWTRVCDRGTRFRDSAVRGTVRELPPTPNHRRPAALSQ